MSRYVTMGVDKLGYLYGIELDESGKQGEHRFRYNPLGYATSCSVIRPVSSDTMAFYQGDMESVREWWQDAVAGNHTVLGLEDFFKECVENECDGFWYDESWPAKDESGCYELLEDPENPTLKAGGFSGDDENGGDFRKHVEKLIEESDAINLTHEDMATWEAAGWWAPSEPFVIELAPRDILDEYYLHLEKTHDQFRRTEHAQTHE